MLICPSCGAENPEGFRFCGRCAAPLVAQEPAARELRKTVTVLFCDVTGSTTLGERLDPESLRRVLLRYFESTERVVVRHGGTVEKFMGDAVMAVFGVPLLHEDDALRAVRAAAEMREALAELNEELAEAYGTTLEARVGVNTGEVVTGTEERLATGDAINVAARLEQAAQPGEVLLGEETLRLTRTAVEVEPVEPLALKGKAEPVPAFRLLSVDPVGPARRLDAPMVGRELDLERLGDAFTQAVRGSSCRLCTIVGAAGVGKSRLVAGFLDSLDGATVVRGRCLPYGDGITYWPAVEVVKQLPSPRSLGLDEPAAETLRGLLDVQTRPTTSEEIAWAFRKLLEAASQQEPLVCVFDDLQWGEETFLDLVEQFAYLSRGAPILLLCMARPDLLDRRPGWQAPLRLQPLDARQSDRLLGQRLGERRLEPALHERILAAAGGIPLFLEEMVAMLLESGERDVAVPPTIQALLGARLDQLDPAERAVLERGAAEGEIFHRGAVQALGPDEAQLTIRLTALVRKELLRPEEAQITGEDAFRFRHLLLRDTAYDSVPKSIRAELHERLAGWLEEHGHELVELDELLGYHLEQAYRYRAELGLVDASALVLARRAAAKLFAGGRAALLRRDESAAASLLSRAVDLLPEGDPERLAALLDLVEALRYGGELARARSVLEEAIGGARAAGDERLEARARLFRIADGLTIKEGLLEAEKTVTVFERHHDDAGLARAWLAIGQSRVWLGRVGEAEPAYQRAAEYARQANDPRLASQVVAYWMGAKAGGPAPVEEGIAFGEAVLRTEGERHFVYVRGPLAQLYAMAGRFERARALAARAIALAAKYGLRGVRANLSVDAGMVELLAGDLEAAESELRTGYEIMESIGATSARVSLAALLADVLSRLRRDEEAARLLDEVTRIAEGDDVDAQILWRAVRAQILVRRGESAEAERLAREAVALAAPTDFLLLRTDALSGLADVLDALGQPEEAAETVQEALGLLERKGNLVSAGRARARLAELREAVASEP